jgi:predicted ATPase/class 3 adenylate cyclase
VRCKNPATRKFCRECGAKLLLVCPQCGTENLPDDKFCGECGHNFKKPKEAPSIDYSEPQSYTPKFLADKILTTRSSIEGERKLVTVLFADVADYTAMAEKLDPEEVHQIMDGCFKILMDEIHKYEGTINQFTGDGIMALFGAPVAHEDHAQRACYAALAIQKGLENYEEKIKKEYGMRFKMRIGLNSGSVVVGAIGDDLRMDYTAIGDTTNLASRMESMALPGTVLVSENAYKMAQDYFVFKSPDRLQMKGKEKPQQVYQLIKPGEISTRIEASEAKGLTKFVGRKNSMASLKESLEKAASGSGQIVGIVGEAGVGKSRLILELKQSLSNDEYTLLEGKCLHYGSSVAYLPVLDILRTYFDIKEGDNEILIKEKMHGKFIQLDEKLKNCLPPFQELLSLKVEDETFIQFEPQQKKERIFAAVKDLMARESQNKPLILVIEDLHWIDKTCEQFLDYLINWLADSPILLILLYRPGYVHQWGSKSYYSKMGLRQLTSLSSAKLIRAILYDCEIESELETLILNRSAGVPLYIEELTQSLLENGSIQREINQCFLAIAPNDIQVPDTLQGIIAARIDRIEENLKRIMQVASVIGREFAYRILHAITGMKDGLKSQLLNLQRLEFIYEKSLSPELEYIFKHALTQEVAYNSLLLKKRKEIHARIGKAIEEIYDERPEELYEILAYHYSQSEQINKALQYLQLSGEKSTRNHSLNEAIRFYRQAIEILNKQPETQEIKEKKINVLLSMAIPLRVSGYPQNSLRFLKEGERLAKEIGDEKTLANFFSLIGNLYGTRGDIQLSQRYGEECFEQSKKIQDVEFMAPAAYDLCNVYMFIGEYSKIIDIAPGVIQHLEKTKRKSEFFNRPLSLGMLGNPEKGNAFCEKSLRHAIEIGDLRTMGFCENMCGYLSAIMGDWKLSTDHLQNCIKYFEKANWLWPLSIACSGLAYVNSFLGDREIANKYLEKVHKLRHESPVEIFSSFLYSLLGQTYMNLGDIKSGRKYLERALSLAERNNEIHVQGFSWIGLGQILAKTSSSQIREAEEYIRRGIALLEKINIRPHYSQGYFYLGKLYADTGQKAQAAVNLKIAEEMFQEMGMNYWLTRTQGVLENL